MSDIFRFVNDELSDEEPESDAEEERDSDAALNASSASGSPRIPPPNPADLRAPWVVSAGHMGFTSQMGLPYAHKILERIERNEPTVTKADTLNYWRLEVSLVKHSE
jgi:hypothetical protein